jgi:hypothetical protein
MIPTGSSMRRLLDRTAFTVGRDEYLWADVVLDAMSSGQWRVVELSTRQGLVAARHARAAGVALPDAALDAATRKFRYDRNLISGRDTEAWLSRWELDVADWKDSLRRTLLVERFGDVLRGLTHVGESFGGEMVQRALHADVVCTSLIERFARDLAARAAAHEQTGLPGARDRNGDNTGTVDDIEKRLARLDLALLGLTPGTARDRLAHFRSLQGSFDRFQDALVRPERVRQWVDARKLEWTYFSCRSAVFPDPDAAREALCCVRDDGRDLADVAVMARATLKERRFFLDEAEPATRDLLLGARTGDVLGPVRIEEDWVIFDVRDKRLPRDADPDVRRRAEKELVADGVEREIGRSVRWSVA